MASLRKKENLLQKALQKQYPFFDETLDYTRRFIVLKKIVIGRRATLSVEDNNRRTQEYEKSNLDIVTYDRLVDIERKIIQTGKEENCRRPRNR